MGESGSVVNFLEKVGSGVHLSVNLFSFAFKSPSTFLTSFKVINFLETLSLVDMGKELSLVIGVMLNHQLSNGGGSVIVLSSHSDLIDFFDFIE
tara:strand:+ start:297 stop:578 length:282 start_codon:yes stop_codon:yes gene_type:complete